MNLENKIILITGANGGLGRAFVEYAIKNHAKKIYCCAKDIAALEDLKNKSNAIELCSLDITDKEQIKKLASTIEAIDILINNAGVNSSKKVFEESAIDFEVNVFGTLNVCRTLNHKIAKEGAIINVSSILALVNLPVNGLYCASKSALHSLTQAMRAELASRQIEVYEVLAGPIDTNMSKDQEMEKSKPQDIVNGVFKEYENKNYEIYPDGFSQMIKEGLSKDPLSVEKNFAQSVQ
ncbi:MAG TPA: short-chain dehydrogenase [Sulfurovum sp. UBA12169]|nr:MAG TPA: short-chain dehydrogenase [Sulfurovum sp. UBA12169]